MDRGRPGWSTDSTVRWRDTSVRQAQVQSTIWPDTMHAGVATPIATHATICHTTHLLRSVEHLQRGLFLLPKHQSNQMVHFA